MEEPGEDSLGINERGASETLTAKQVAAEAVLYGERVAVDTIKGLELALEVGGPNGVRGIERCSGPARVRPLTTASSLLDQSSTDEVTVQRAYARNVPVGIERDESGANFSGTEYLATAVADPNRLLDQVRSGGPGQSCARLERSSRPSGPSRS